jgi:hypothetical protein
MSPCGGMIQTYPMLGGQQAVIPNPLDKKDFEG